eukprot:TRINITY_DN68455_c0_g1_i1.p1 TRINITY_DN68455_c0_g1~~TRINITY_DN68455_c0_g1_i1.p1  ORF type:complete len:276 (-),score=36.05 TRINITY_DN68455_c0_g1_i1:381-1208(-)
MSAFIASESHASTWPLVSAAYQNSLKDGSLTPLMTTVSCQKGPTNVTWSKPDINWFGVATHIIPPLIAYLVVKHTHPDGHMESSLLAQLRPRRGRPYVYSSGAPNRDVQANAPPRLLMAVAAPPPPGLPDGLPALGEATPVPDLGLTILDLQELRHQSGESFGPHLIQNIIYDSVTGEELPMPRENALPINRRVIVSKGSFTVVHTVAFQMRPLAPTRHELSVHIISSWFLGGFLIPASKAGPMLLAAAEADRDAEDESQDKKEGAAKDPTRPPK